MTLGELGKRSEVAVERANLPTAKGAHCMKVKIFHISDVLALERDINQWLDDQPAIDIRHTQTVRPTRRTRAGASS